MNKSQLTSISSSKSSYHLDGTSSWAQELFSFAPRHPAESQPTTYQPYFVGDLITKPGCVVAEDQWWTNEAFGVAVIVDGVSSQLGAQASRMAIETLKAVDLSDHSLLAGGLMQVMNTALFQENQRLLQTFVPTPTKSNCKVLLASALVLRIINQVVHYCHLGDTRLMVLRKGVLHNLTEDHSLLQDEIRSGHLQPDERWMIHSPLRHVLTRCLGEWQDDFPCGQWALDASDILLMCSDGLTHTLLHSDISAILTSSPTWHSAEMVAQNLERLLNKVQSHGITDDVSIIMIGNLAGFSPEPRATPPSAEKLG